jgi:ribonuclease HII
MPPVPPANRRRTAPPDDSHELRLRSSGFRIVAGVDEAGRGPLAGPVVAAAVVLPVGDTGLLVRDSKLLNADEREALYEEIVAKCSYGVGIVGPALIDRLNILRATHRAMSEAVSALSPLPDHVLVDGLPVKGLPVSHTAIVKGDRVCRSIAAASIIAKVTRDRLLTDLDGRYPQYGFVRHKGYPTPEHLERLRQHGACPAHRMTFAPVRAVLEQQLPLRSS